jgi:hypothetical protein
MRKHEPAFGRRIGVRTLLLCLGCGAGAVRAQSLPPAVTVETRNAHAQVVFAFGHHVGFGIERSGDTAILHFTRGGNIPAATSDAHGVTAIDGGTDRATIQLAPGARVRTKRQGDRIIVEVLDPVSPVPPPPARRTKHNRAARDSATSTPASTAAPVAVIPAPTIPAAVPPIIASAAPASPAVPSPVTPAVPSPVTPVDPTIAAAAVALAAPPPSPAEPEVPTSAATTADLPFGTAGTAAMLPFNTHTGAAAFWRDGEAWVVFDERRQIDLAELQDNPLFAHAIVQVLTAATLLRLPLDEGSELRLTHVDGGWKVAAVPSAAPPVAISVNAKEAQFELPAAGSSQVVVVPDPETGQNLLVGTLHSVQAGVPVARRVPAFVLEPTWQGVLVEPISDSTTLRTTLDGFVVQSVGEPLSTPPDAARTLAESAFLTRRFDIPTGAPDTLQRRLQGEVDSAGGAPAQSRGRPRKAAATTLIALGMGFEAQAMLQLATEEDPRLLTDVDVTGLAAIAAMLGGRGAEADGINDPALHGTDEIALWRAVHAAQAHEGAPEAAPVFAATIKLLLAYPAPLRHAILPLAAETMALGGAPEAADALLSRLQDDHALDLARAIRLEAKNQTADALKMYDAIVAGRDRLLAARAATRATLLRLKTNAITPTAAATELERQFLNWRGDGRELDLRLRVAALRRETGAWRPAFTLLRETAVLYPDSAPMIQARMVDLMTALISGPAAANISPLELVALTEENAELVAAVAPAKVAELIADKLVALDLPGRAGPVLERMMQAAPVGPGQATLGLRLATLRLGEGNDAGAQAALSNSNAPGLSAALIERRGLIGARLAARAGHTGRAATILSAIGTPGADDLRASLLTDAQDWRGAAAAVADLSAKTVPPDGPLSPAQQDTVLRLASMLSRAGDAAGLRALGERENGRMEGPRSGMFRLLTAAPIGGVSDLPRSSAELSLVKAIPGGLSAVGAR